LLRTKAKGARAEHKARRLLEQSGYYVIKAGGSFGVFDLIAIGANACRCIQVKSGSAYASGVEREQMQVLPLPPWCTREIWRYPDRQPPIIEVL
jgi:Holliday junction resolvase